MPHKNFEKLILPEPCQMYMNLITFGRQMTT